MLYNIESGTHKYSAQLLRNAGDKLPNPLDVKPSSPLMRYGLC